MNIKNKYVAYNLNSVLNSPNLCLEKISFDSWQANEFDTEEECIKALVKDELTYQNIVILKEIYITNYE